MTAAKEEEQRAQKENERHCPDAICSLTRLGLQLLLVEVSGPPATNDHSHFAGNRLKLAKNLKSMLKRIHRKVPAGSDDILCDIKLYGIQFYCTLCDLKCFTSLYDLHSQQNFRSTRTIRFLVSQKGLGSIWAGGQSVHRVLVNDMSRGPPDNRVRIK